jgi:hypothetical protein
MVVSSTDLVQIGHITFYTVFYEVICSIWWGYWLGADGSHNILYCLLRGYMFYIWWASLTWCRWVRRCCRRSGCNRPVPSSSPQGPSCCRPGPCNLAPPAATGQSHESWILTLIPPSGGGLYGSQFLVGKLFEVHKGYDSETIIYSSSFLCWFIIYFPNWWDRVVRIARRD